MRRFAWWLAVLTALGAVEVSARETASYRFEAEVTGFVDFVEFFPLDEAIAPGDRISGQFFFDPDLPSGNPPPDQRWLGAVSRWEITAAGETFQGTGGFVTRDTSVSPSRWLVGFSVPNRASFLNTRDFAGVSVAWRSNSPVLDTIPLNEPGMIVDGEVAISFVEGLVGVAALARLTSLLPGAGTVSAQGSQAVWRAKPAAEQVIGGSDRSLDHSLNAALWVDDAQETATLTLFGPPVDISLPRLHCGTAGQTGPMLWQASTVPATAWKQWQFVRSDLLDPGGECPVATGTVAGIASAARQRQLYLEYERDGVTHRGQLWPKSLMADRVRVAPALASSAQLIDAGTAGSPNKLAARLRLNEQTGVLDHLEYILDASNSAGRLSRAALHCAPPGVVGPAIAQLSVSGTARWQALIGEDIMPTRQDGPCGLEINTIASVVEAYLRGHLYFRVESDNGTAWRGQVLRP